jgi:hypothetical protein
LAPMYYRGASAAVVVFDVTNRASFEGAKSWVKELQRRGDPSVVIALAGNKADVKEKRVVEAEEAREYARENNLIYMDTSAKTNLNVKEIFVAIGEYRKEVTREREQSEGGMGVEGIFHICSPWLFFRLQFVLPPSCCSKEAPSKCAGKGQRRDYQFEGRA